MAKHVDLDLIKLLDSSNEAVSERLKKQIRALQSLASVRTDLREAIGAMDLLAAFGDGPTPRTKAHDFKYELLGVPCDIRASLLSSALSLYCRCFNKSEVRFNPGIKPLLRSRPDLKATHECAFDLRDKFIAHFVKTEQLDDRMFLRLSEADQSDIGPTIWLPFLRMSIPEKTCRLRFYELLSFVHDRINDRCIHQEEELLCALLKLKCCAEWLSQADELKPDSLHAVFSSGFDPRTS